MAVTHSCSYSEWFDANRIYVKTDDEKTFSRPLEAFPLLKDATAIAVPKRNHQVYFDTLCLFPCTDVFYNLRSFEIDNQRTDNNQHSRYRTECGVFSRKHYPT